MASALIITWLDFYFANLLMIKCWQTQTCDCGAHCAWAMATQAASVMSFMTDVMTGWWDHWDHSQQSYPPAWQIATGDALLSPPWLGWKLPWSGLASGMRRVTESRSHDTRYFCVSGDQWRVTLCVRSWQSKAGEHSSPGYWALQIFLIFSETTFVHQYHFR